MLTLDNALILELSVYEELKWKSITVMNIIQNHLTLLDLKNFGEEIVFESFEKKKN